jgi:hypothetical protein
MRSTALGQGSITDVITGVTAQPLVRDDLVAVLHSFVRLRGALAGCAVRAATGRRRGGSVAGLDASARWLAEVIRDHPGLADPAAEGLRSELLRLGDRCRG